MITQVVVILKLDMYNGLGYILPIIILSISYNIVKFFEVETVFYEVSESFQLEIALGLWHSIGF